MRARRSSRLVGTRELFLRLSSGFTLKRLSRYTTPYASIASATLMKAAMFAPFT